MEPNMIPVNQDQSSGKAGPSKSLCERCDDIDFEWLYGLKNIPETGLGIMSLGPLDNLGGIVCEVCALFTKVRPHFAKAETYHLRAYSTTHVFDLPRSQKSGVLLAVVGGKLVKSLSRISVKQVAEEGMITLESLTVSKSLSQQREIFQMQPIDPDCVNYQRMNHWLSDCLAKHEHCQLKPSRPQFVPGMLVIDCENKCTVPWESHFQYYTLSYVCGGLQKRDTSLIEDFEYIPSFSRTILDAINIVLHLGARYLWVDQYCIRGSERQSQIRLMSRIYERAIATLVAVTGENDQSPIPGVSTSRRDRQLTALVGKHRLCTTFPDISRFLSKSVWRTRAWTFQEAMLSTRCLFFTDAQVYFTCRSSERSESILEPVEAQAVRGKAVSLKRRYLANKQDIYIFGNLEELNNQENREKWSHTRLIPNLDGVYTHPSYHNFYVHLREYSERLLTDESDTLDAFKGILEQSGWNSYWGIPFLIHGPGFWLVNSSYSETLKCEEVDSAEDGFAKGLLWTTQITPPPRLASIQQGEIMEKLSRREPNCPSWSWACLRPLATYTNRTKMGRDGVNGWGERYWTRATFHVEDQAGDLISLSDLEGPLIREQTTWLHITAPHASVYIRKGAESWQVLNGSSTVVGEAWIDASDKNMVEAHPETQTWRTVQLCETQGNGYWMILKNVGEYYRRIGLLRREDGGWFSEHSWPYTVPEEGKFRIG